MMKEYVYSRTTLSLSLPYPIKLQTKMYVWDHDRNSPQICILDDMAMSANLSLTLLSLPRNQQCTKPTLLIVMNWMHLWQ